MQNDTPTNPYPTVLIRADNKSAESWSLKASNASITEKALMRLQCCLMINNTVGLKNDYIKGDLNVIADYISRKKQQTNKLVEQYLLLQQFTGLQCCQRFHLIKELLFHLWEALLTDSFTDQTKPINNLVHIEEEWKTSSSFANVTKSKTRACPHSNNTCVHTSCECTQLHSSKVKPCYLKQ